MVAVPSEVGVSVADAVVISPEWERDDREEEAGDVPPDSEAVRVTVFGTELLVVGRLVPGLVSVTGHIVVEIATVDVTTLVESAGQLVTVAAQLVTVTSLVV